MSNDVERMIRCRPLTDHDRRFFGEYRILPESKALEMAALGEVEFDDGTLAPAAPPKPIQSTIDYLRRDAFTKKDHRVAWVQDMSKIGGAELSNCTVVEAGESSGFDIVGVTPGQFNKELLTQADIVIINNCMEFAPEQFRALQYAMYERRIRWIKYEHDYRELRRQNISRAMYEQSMLNVFISPAHRDRFAGEMGVAGIALPLAVDVSKYHVVRGVLRDLECVLLPVPKKGIGNAIKWARQHPRLRYRVLGQLNNPLPGKVDYLPTSTPHEMPRHYSSVGAVLHMPDRDWAGDRVLFEAVLCGCSVFTNHHAGHSSWDVVFDWRDPLELRRALEEGRFTFWKEVERCLDTSLY